MIEIQLLTEKDMEYFRKKAEEGSAVILELTEEQLLRLDFSYWRDREPDTIKEAEIIQWLQENQIEIQKLYDGTQKKETIEEEIEHVEGERYSTLAEWMLSHELTETQYSDVRQMICKGYTEKQILLFLLVGSEMDNRR